MYDKHIIINGFKGLVGIPQTDNPNFQKISGHILYNGENSLIDHPLINVENLDMTAKNYDLFHYDDYDSGTIYNQGDRIRFNSEVYESLVNSNQNNQPDTSNSNWQLISLLSLHLERVFEWGYEETVRQVFLSKKNRQETKTLFSQLRAYEGMGRFTDRIINEGKLVGFEFKLRKDQNIVSVIERIGLQLSEAQIDDGTNDNRLTLRLYHSSQIEPLSQIKISQTKQASFQWHDISRAFKMHYLNEMYDSAGSFFIMYDQNDLVGQAIDKRYNWLNPSSCSSCGNSYNGRAFAAYNKYLFIRPVEVPASARNQDNSINMWDLQKTVNNHYTNYGLNFDLTVRCDLTDFILKQKDLFIDASKMVITAKLLREIKYSTRQNSIEQKVRSAANHELQSTKTGGGGFISMLKKEIEAVDFEMSELNSSCLPCKNKGGVRYSSIGLVK